VVTVLGSTFSDNVAFGGPGGGLEIYPYSYGSVIRNSTFSGNRATDLTNGRGGGLFVPTDANGLAIENCTFTNNTAAVGGGGIYAQGYLGTVRVTSTIVSGNFSPD